jgi:hypothetical protein
VNLPGLGNGTKRVYIEVHALAKDGVDGASVSVLLVELAGTMVKVCRPVELRTSFPARL